MTEVRIEYQDFTERLAARPINPDVYELNQFSHFVPLAPGDWVRVRDGTIIGYHTLQPAFVVEAYFRMDTPYDVVQQYAAEWKQATFVEVPTALTVLVVSRSYDWLKQAVESCELVEWMEVHRVPFELFPFEERRMKV